MSEFLDQTRPRYSRFQASTWPYWLRAYANVTFKGANRRSTGANSKLQDQRWLFGIVLSNAASLSTNVRSLVPAGVRGQRIQVLGSKWTKDAENCVLLEVDVVPGN